MPATALSRQVANFFRDNEDQKVITIHELTRELVGNATKKNLGLVSKATRVAQGLLLKNDPPMILVTLWERDLTSVAGETEISESEGKSYTALRSSSRGASCIAGYVVGCEETKALVMLAFLRQNNGTAKQQERLAAAVNNAKNVGLLTEEDSKRLTGSYQPPANEA